MKPLSILAVASLFAASTLGAFAAKPAASTNAAPVKPKAPVASAPATNAAPANPAPAPPPVAKSAASAPATPSCDAFTAFLDELDTALALTDNEKATITALYVTDGATLQKDLNDDSLSPLKKADNAASLRDTRNGKIDTLLITVERQRKFHEIETKYRVVLLEEAADKGLAAPVAPAPAPAKK